MQPDGAIETSDPARLPAAPLVSVLMVTYKHAAYLAEAIDSVLAQRCDFPFELLIGEDRSPDDTLRIALDYQAQHPDVIRVVHGEVNVGAGANLGRITDRARGKYIAYCDGDDYWCDPDKLARQAAIAEADPRIGAVHSDWVRACRVDGEWRRDARSEHAGVSRRWLEGDLFGTFYNPKVLRSSALMYRLDAVRAFFETRLHQDKVYYFGDTVMAAWITSRYRVGYVDAVTAVYRESPNSALRSGAFAKIAFLRSALEFDSAARRYFADRADYPQAYRWEIGIGLLLRACLVRDWASARFALADLRAHYGFAGFLRAAWRAASLRVRRG